MNKAFVKEDDALMDTGPGGRVGGPFGGVSGD